MPKSPASTPGRTSPPNEPAGEVPAGTAIEAIDLDRDADSALDAESLQSSTASISASVFEYRKLNGRTYQSTDTTEYWAPNDDQQNEGLDLIHHGLLQLFGNKLFVAPIGDHPKRVLDLGTGTGIWAMDFGDQFPSAEVIGTDISPIQPAWVPPNVKFVIDDLMHEWAWSDSHFDFVHMRSLYGIIPELSSLYSKAFRCTAPGGWVQHLEMDVQLESDHVTFPEDHIFRKWAQLVYKGGEKIGRPFDLARGHKMKESLEEAGFVDVTEVKRRVPLHGWPKDPDLSETGRLIQAAFDESLEGFGTFLFTQVLGLTSEEVALLVVEMRKEARKRSNLHWFLTTVVYGRKP